jgi:outer membrane protein OmpA-like peptidoglycan-associated protein
MAEDAVVPPETIVETLVGEEGLTRGLGGANRGAKRVSLAHTERLRAIDRSGEDGLTPDALADSRHLLSGLRLNMIDVPIQFEFASAEATDAGFSQLNALGTALTSDRLAAASFVLVGHTDSTGVERANRRLSKRRADAIREYLATNFRIDRSRLIALGFGESVPKRAEDTEAAENRRVEVQAYFP